MRSNLHFIVLTALFTALTAVGAFIKIPVGPAPITLQLLFIAMAGMLLGPFWGAVSQILYVALGLIGVPLFTAGGGFSYIYNPTFGFLLGFILVPIVIGTLLDKYYKADFVTTFFIVMLGMLSCYLIGAPYMYMILHNVMGTPITLPKALLTGFLIFIPGDIVKSMVTAYLSRRLTPIRLMMRHSRKVTD